jgi:hypothetical protein
MYQVMKAFVEAGYSNTMTLDHTPRFVEGYEAAGTGYAIGYMRARCFSALGGAGGGGARRWIVHQPALRKPAL